MNTFTQFIKDLTSIVPRRGLSESIATDLIKKYLTQNGIPFNIQEFKAIIPITKKAELFVDNKQIPCIGASFKSGILDKSTKIMSSFDSVSEPSMIIFNPISLGICLQSYKGIPTVAIDRENIVDLVMGNEIRGEVIVQEFEFTSQNILVGNTNNPNKIIFAHYDSIVGAGAVDNAASVDVLMQIIINDGSLLNNNLIVFAGSEEESISSHEGFYGFEMFDKKYSNLIDNASEILVLDEVGIGEATFTNDHLDWVFGISRLESISNKVYWMQNDQSLVMKYYHTELDTLNILSTDYINQARQLLQLELKST
jgi:hypothetical protein